MTETLENAYVIGPGANGLATVISMADAGGQVEVFEAEAQAGAKRRYTHCPKGK